jgi:hypothetical protein
MKSYVEHYIISYVVSQIMLWRVLESLLSQTFNDLTATRLAWMLGDLATNHISYDGRYQESMTALVKALAAIPGSSRCRQS